MIRSLIFSYILFAPFTAWLALSGWLRLPVMILIFTLLLAAPFILARLGDNRPSIHVEQEDSFLLLFSILLMVTIIINPLNEKTFNHTLAYLFSFFVSYFGFRALVNVYGIRFSEICRFASYSMVLCSIIIFIEWVAANILGIYIRKYFILDNKVSNMLYYSRFLFKSVGGVAEEPGWMAFNLNMMFALGLYNFKASSPFKIYGYIALYLIASICLASSGGIGFMIMAFFFVFLNKTRGYTLFLKILAAAALPFVFVYTTNSIFIKNKIVYFFESIHSKITFQHTSANMRLWAWDEAIKDWITEPWFGKGPGFGNLNFEEQTGYLSFYFKVLAENGVFALIAIVGFFGMLLLKARMLPPDIRIYAMLSIAAGFMHLSIHDAFYHPTLWIAISATQLSWKENREKFQI